MWMFLSNFKKIIEDIKIGKWNFQTILIKLFKRIIYLIITITLQKGTFKIFNIIMFRVKVLNKNGKQYKLFKIILSKDLKRFISEYDPGSGDDIMDTVLMLESHFDTIDNKKKKFIQTEEGLAELDSGVDNQPLFGENDLLNNNKFEKF
jgi:hypothetical protein